MQQRFDGLAWDARHLHIATDAAGVGLWSWNVDTGDVVMDERAHALWDVPLGQPVTFALLSERIHPEDLGRVGAAFQATRSTAGPYEIDFRILHGRQIWWVSARGQGADLGIIDGMMFSVFMDVTERKQAEEAREMLAAEMSHRVKNLFAVTSAMAAIAARSTSTTEDMVVDLTRRMQALGSAHDLVRPAGGQGPAQPVMLRDLLAILLSPYNNEGGLPVRITVRGPDVAVGETGATAIALIAHELATNSIKYGALSAAAGTLDVAYSRPGDDVVLVWRERGGPAVAFSSDKAGFGSRLIARSLSGQLDGSIATDWPVDGLVATLRLSSHRLAM